MQRWKKEFWVLCPALIYASKLLTHETGTDSGGWFFFVCLFVYYRHCLSASSVPGT